MIKKIFFYFSKTNCPFENLSIENSLLLKIEKNQKIYFFYRNAPSVVMGRFQNPWKECDFKRVVFGDEKIHLVRRQSGGGTVYHDEGNLNFCIIDGERTLSKDENHTLIIEVLEKLGINAYKSDRGDLMVHYEGPKKISGSAFKQKKDSSFHHGTLLIDSNLDSLNGLLRSKHEIVDTKSISSVSSAVINLKKIRSDLVMSMVEEKFLEVVEEKCKSSLSPVNQSLEVISCSQQFIDTAYVESLKSWDWIIGETPWFKLKQIHERGFHVSLESKKGVISSLDIRNDDKSKQDICDFVARHLVELRMQKSHISKALSDISHPQNITEISDIRDLLFGTALFC